MAVPARELAFAEGVLERARAAATGDAEAAAGFRADAAAGGVTLRARVLQCKRVPAGSGVSYGHTYVTERATTLALVDIGYGHGLPRKAGNRARVCVAGALVPIVGRVAMDACVVDVGDLPVSPGDAVTIFGAAGSGALPLAQWAASVGEEPLSVLASLRLGHGEGTRGEGTRGGDSLGIAPFDPANRAVVSGDALRANVALMRARVAPAELIAVVKDGAYGHGLAGAVGAFVEAGVRCFGALDVATAHRVHELAPEARIFAWVLDEPDALPRAISEGIELGVTSEHSLARVAAAARIAGRPARVHLKADTGLHRAGVRAEGWAAFVADALARPDAIEVVGLWTHISEASDAEDTAAIGRFHAAVARAEALGVTAPLLHLAASAAAFARADARLDAVRVGAFLYGIAPGDGLGPAALGLRPAMALESRIARRWDDAAGSFGVVPLGGVHGIPVDCAGAWFAVEGQRCAVVAVEPLRTVLRVDPHVRAGATVVLFGDGSRGEPTLQELADAAGTIGEELVTRLERTITREWVR